jgi:hypothetical protein
MVKFPATRRVLFHHLVNVLLIEFKFAAGLAKHLVASLAPDLQLGADQGTKTGDSFPMNFH